MANIIVALTILFILGLSISRVIIEKRRGSKCCGCALSEECASTKNANNKSVAQRIEIKELT